MAWATKDTDISDWARIALMVSVDTLPDTDTALSLLRGSAIRFLWTDYPALATAWSKDLDNVPVADQPVIAEVVGWKVGAVLARLPRPEGAEIVKSIKVGQLAESYMVPDLEELGGLFDSYSAGAIVNLTSVTGLGPSALYPSGSPLPAGSGFVKGRPVADDSGNVLSDLYALLENEGVI